MPRSPSEGRKYGCSLCVISQRPAEIDPTILSQCSTVFSLRLTNDRDQEIIKSAVAGVESSLVAFLPSLGAREAIAFGDGVPLPTMIRFDELPPEALPRSATAVFSERWRTSVGDERMLDQIVERWRMAGVCGTLDSTSQASLMADTLNLGSHGSPLGSRSDQQIERRATDRQAAIERLGLDRSAAPDRASSERAPLERAPSAPPRPELRPAPASAPAPTSQPAMTQPAVTQPAMPSQAPSQYAMPPQPVSSPAPAVQAQWPAMSGTPMPPAGAPASNQSISAARLSLRERLLRPRE